MRSIILTALLLMGVSGFSQTDKLKDSVINPSSNTGYVRAPSSDSFDFCGLRFSTFRDCVEGSRRNCCEYALDPLYVSCTDVGALSWAYFPSLAIAEMNVKDNFFYLKRDQKRFSKEIIYCNLLGNRIKAYRVKCTTMKGLKWSGIRMGAVVNGQAVLLRLDLANPVHTNEQIPPVFRQIVTLAE